MMDSKRIQAILKRKRVKNTPDLFGNCPELVWLLRADEYIRSEMDQLLLMVVNDELPPRVRPLFYCQKQNAIPKGKTGVRFVKWASVYTALAHAYVLGLVDTKFLEPHQVGIGASGGSARAVATLQAASQALGDQVVCCLDIEKAYPSTDRGEALHAAFQREELLPVYHALHGAYRDPSLIFTMDPQTKGVVGVSLQRNGLFTGDQVSSLLFCNRIHRFLTSVVDGLEAESAAVMDDCNFVVGLNETRQLLGRFVESLHDEYVLSPKSFLLWPHSTPPPQAFRDTCADFGLGLRQRWAPVLGSFVGDFTNQGVRVQVADHLRAELGKHKELWEVLARPELPPQVGFQVLQASLAVRIHHWLRQVSPDIWGDVIRDFDSEVRKAFVRLLGSSVELSERQTLQLEWPMREGGFGLRSAASLAPLAYFAHHVEVAPLIREMSVRRGWEIAVPVGMDAAVQRVRELSEAHQVVVDGLQAGWLLPDVKAQAPFWEWFGDLSVNGPLVTALAGHDAKLAAAISQDGRLRRVQRLVSGALGAEVGSKLKEGATEEDRARLNVLRGCNLAVSAIPEVEEWQMREVDWRIMALLRLGVPVFDVHAVPRQQCKCGFRLSPENLNAHLLSCHKFTKARVERHNDIARAIRDSVEKLGVPVRLEPAHFRSHPEARNGRSDLEFAFPRQMHLETDVTVVCPIKRSERKVVACQGGCRHRRGCGDDRRVVEDAESEKLKNHGREVQRKGNDFAPFVVTSFGKLGKGAKKVVNKLAGKAAMQMPLDWESPGDWARQMKTTIACRVQRGNAQLVVDAYHRLTGRFWEGAGRPVGGWKWERRGRRRQARRPRRYNDAGEVYWD